MTLGGWDWGVLGGYLALLVAIGSWQSRKASASAEDYFAGGRRLPWWIAGTSMIAASFASDTPLLVSGLVRQHGIWGNWVWWGNAISLVLTVFFFSRLWRRSGVLTEVELTELRYSGKGAAALRGFKAVYWGLLFNAFVAGAWSVTGLRKVLEVATGLPATEAIILCSLIACVYSVLAGFWGVVATDLFQFVLALFGSVACAWFAVERAGGWDAMIAAVPPEKLDFAPGPESPMFLWFLSLVLVNWWAWKNTDGGGVLVQRMASCKDEKHAVWATLWFQVFHTALRGWPWIVVALASIALVPEAALIAKAGGKPDHEKAYAVMITTVVPAGLRGLLVGWFLAEFMSSINTYTNWGSSLLVNDGYKRFVKRLPGDLERAPGLLRWLSRLRTVSDVAAGRVATVLVMLGAMATAFLSDDIAGAFDYVLKGTAAIGVVAAARWLWWRVNAWTEVVAMVMSPLATFVLYPQIVKPHLLPLLEIGDNRMVELCTIVLLGCIPALVVTLLTRPDSDATLQAFYRKVRPPGPGWRRIAAQCPGVTSDLRLAQTLAFWVAGCATVFGLLYAVHALLFARPWGWAALVGSLAVLVGLVWRTRDVAAPTA